MHTAAQRGVLHEHVLMLCLCFSPYVVFRTDPVNWPVFDQQAANILCHI